MKNIWILTEERPKETVIQVILDKIALDQGITFVSKDIRVKPIFRNNLFTFLYRVEVVASKDIGNIYLKLASGNSSFVDFLVFIQEHEPNQSDKPLYAIEETKTDDSESRNTGVYQRCSKFVYVEFFYPGIKKIMLYNLSIPQKETPTETNIFGMRMLKTMEVEVLGKVYEKKFEQFSSLEDLATSKNTMKLPPAGNVPIRIEVLTDKINISGRLFKAGSLGHDPNIGALTAIALCIRKWEKNKDIVITHHGLEQHHINSARNKFIQIANRLNIKLEGLVIPSVIAHEEYWHYENAQEKTATILLHVILVNYSNAEVIYSNHGGTERSYFLHKEKGPVAIEKYQEGMREAYKLGAKELIIHIPDIIVFDPTRKEVINIEGKKYSNKKAGIEELGNYDYIEKNLIIPSHKPDKIIRTVVLFGSKNTKIEEKEISFLLNEDGLVILNDNAPKIFEEALIKVLSTQDK